MMISDVGATIDNVHMCARVYVVHTCIIKFILFYRIDDMQDSDLRRGIPVVHSVLGLANTVSAANYIMFVALERAVYLHPVVSKTHMQLIAIHIFQA